MGYKIVNNINNVNLVFINTCAVRKKTENHILERLKEIERKRQKYGFHVIVGGCLAAIRPYMILNTVKANILIPDNIEKIGEVIASKKNLADITTVKRTILPEYGGGIRYIVPICSGCLGNCTFCAGKIARPILKSYPIKVIVNKIKDAVKKGVKEIYLTGQDVASYGYDLKLSLIDLLEEILKIKGDFKIRIGMMEPSKTLEILDDLIEIYSDQRIYKYIHIPCQSGDEEILRKMNRKYTPEEYIYLVEKFRKKYPFINITTDIIVGFPGETWDAFNNTLKLIEKIKPDKAHVARYSLRPFTRASLFTQISEKEKKKRSKIAIKKCLEIAYIRNKMLLNKKMRVLVTGINIRHKSILARTFNYKQVIIEDIFSKKYLGKNIYVKINECTSIDLRGRLISTILNS